MSLQTQIRTLATHSGITLRLSGEAIELHNGNDTARMFIAANRRGIVNLLRIRQRGERDGRCSKSTCCTLATIEHLASGADIYSDPDERAAYCDGFAAGEVSDGGGLSVDEARETCECGVCQMWKDAGNAAISEGKSEVCAAVIAAQVCRTCNERETV